jgi:transcription antitermination factor NusG
MNDWHIWTLTQQRYKHVVDFLNETPEVETFLYPTVVKEYDTKNGKRKRDVPLYSNYIFLKYRNNPRMFNRLSTCPGLKNYVGECSEQEIAAMEELTKKKYEDLVPAADVKVGSNYKLIGTPFKGFICTVRSKEGAKLVVTVEVFGSDRLLKCSVEDISLEG